MKNRKFALLSILAFTVIGAAGCSFIKIVDEKEEKPATYTVPTTYTGDYYNTIDANQSGNTLLNSLRLLNAEMKTSEVGYNRMGTSAGGQFKWTDFDPATVKFDSNGHPYGDKIVSFYSGTVMTGIFNREHVWPNTHGGNLVENDIHMVRPTVPSENGSRGHSYYVEGMCSDSNKGWDPAMESFGKEDYRGDCARIILYCMVASNQLTIEDSSSASSQTSNNKMGVLSDLLSWNLRYPVQSREQIRNNGGEYLQGNRNPFIDHPEYACKIWRGTNSKTAAICSGYNQ